MKNLDPNNDSHWITHDEFVKRAHAQNTITQLTKAGAPRPADDSPLWNEWAANNPTPQAKALAQLDPSDSLMKAIKGITQGARPVNH